MKLIDKAKEYVEVVKIHLQNHHLTDDLSYYAFMLSLLPIPGVQQASQVIDRMFANKSIKSQLDVVWGEINATNEKISAIDDEIEKLHEIAATVKYNNELDEQTKELSEAIIKDTKENTEWIMETENWSYQSVLNSIVEADFATIIAKDNSVNSVENTEIKAKRTHLHASNNSKNYFDKTNFSDGQGTVGMQGMTTQGNIFVQGSGIGFGEGGALIFGGSPNLISGNCPFCNTLLQVDKRELSGKTQVQCFNCKRIITFTIN